MTSHKNRFIQLALKYKALKFGEFKLKSGRVSPYFFNAGEFKTSTAIAELGKFYAATLMESGVNFDVVFGPAYKGIPLATATCVALADTHNLDVGYCFNRKEAKTHGEKGSLVGAPLKGDVVIVDDVITAGTAIREALSIIEYAQARPSAIIIGLNRQERGKGDISAIDELQQSTGVPVLSIVSLNDILEYLDSNEQPPELIHKMKKYQQDYGV